jgi:radical SAM protein with 4Fe4S-binding SPASM domain
MWSSCVFTWNGIVVPCCFDKDAKHQMGSVQNDPFLKIWRSSTYLGFRKGVLSNRSQIDICKNCSEGSKVWA